MKNKKIYIKENIYKISIDTMGGDYGPQIVIPASVYCLKKYRNLYIILAGIYTEIKKELIYFFNKYDHKRLKIIHTKQIIKMNESPTNSIKKKNSSMRLAINLVKKKKTNACISAGNTGSLMVTSKFVLKTLKKIERPAIVYAIPSLKNKSKKMKQVYMLDLGANINCTPKQLFQFSIMGSVLYENIKNKSKPRIALLNIGSEETKGSYIIKDTSKKLIKYKFINYIGFIESNEIFNNKADVIVCDGFIGNIAIKTMEGTAKIILKIIINNFNRNIFTKISMILCSFILRRIKKKLDMNKYNGASLLGLKGIVIKSHGNAKPKAFETAIKESIKEIKEKIPKKINIIKNI